MITAVIFDYGGTMTARFESVYSLLSKFFGVRQEEAKERTRGRIHAFVKGEITEKEFLLSLGKIFGSKRAIENLEAIFGGYSDVNEPKMEMVGIVKRLRENGFMTALLSNVIKPHVEFNRSRGNYDHFSPVILSCDVGMMKPERCIYELALKKMGKVPGECVFIDDLPNYIAAAKELGIRTILFESPEQVKEELSALGISI